MSSLDQFALAEIDAAEVRLQRRTLKDTSRDSVNVVREGQKFISFACNDYLGLAKHPEVIEAGQKALAAHGAGAAASRLITGNHPLYAPLEEALAKHKGTQAALVFGSGYMANIGLIPALVGEGDLILADKLVHACILDGAKLSGATVKRFRHNDPIHARALLEESRADHGRVLIVTEHIFSMDGDRAPLDKLSDLARDYDAWLMVDDAHGIGFFDQHQKMGVDLWMGTLSKSLGGYGGYVAASKAVIDYLITSARSFVFTTGLPPATCATALAALTVMQREPERAQRARHHAQRVAKALRLPEPAAAIIPWVLGSEEAALQAGDWLKEQGLLAVAVRPPTVPAGTARLRFAFSADHTDEQVDRLIAALTRESLAA